MSKHPGRELQLECAHSAHGSSTPGDRTNTRSERDSSLTHQLLEKRKKYRLPKLCSQPRNFPAQPDQHRFCLKTSTEGQNAASPAGGFSCSFRSVNAPQCHAKGAREREHFLNASTVLASEGREANLLEEGTGKASLKVIPWIPSGTITARKL